MTMRFEEVSERLGAVVDYPGNKDHGKPLNVAIPNLGRMRLWQAVHGGYSWAIAYEPGVDHWTDAEKAKFVGFSASYRLTRHRDSSQTIRIDGGPWDSFAKAEDACKRTWRQIRNAS
ncbi:hypothetical protein JQ594_15415 [Bradyrhizobium manausense]|uniref:hypothetical protein n=1 Tax=Bradyrhizobium manausense TaxID=989370 RepID=UPI001BAD1CA8|nr:hypothetical protein [Bradyrhizobium manausense]MBR0687319.1 hypothetical protein [Bradyrhizobium manausense]